MLLLMEAFDKVPLNRLTVKLKSYGIGGVVLDCWKAFLTDTEQRSVVKDDYPEWNEVPSGFPQSSVLRPILFVSYINDLPDRVAGDPMLYMVAGDTKLSRTLFDVSDTDILQWDMDDMEEWSYEWPMDWRFICHMLKIWSYTIRTAYASIYREKFSKKHFNSVISHFKSKLVAQVYGAQNTWCMWWFRASIRSPFQCMVT